MAIDPLTKILEQRKYEFSNIFESLNARRFSGTYTSHAGKPVRVETVYDDSNQAGKLLVHEGTNVVINVDYTTDGQSVSHFRFRKGDVAQLINVVLSLAVDGGMV